MHNFGSDRRRRPKCANTLTGSSSRGKLGKYYTYYHCSSKCGVRFKAKEVNKIFERQLMELVSKEPMVEIFKNTFLENFKTKTQKIERTKLLKEIDDLNYRLQKALIQKIDGELDNEDYNFIKKTTNEQIHMFEVSLSNLADENLQITQLIKSESKKIFHLPKYYMDGDIEQQRQVLGSMFPEKSFLMEPYIKPHVLILPSLLYF
ncbi:hypothetical protein J2787_001065 [Chryseobacterium rhizosphaerae]|uniref:Recombinase zinc beta ribbon domain-containing protein n=1 Tax=Chryseobacterium rhizosphaerae TaxID=395937 RepID=A0AAE4C3I5_9FLAO|nr:hypothetical protein [Chryseobacterium rhizosphaerae]MDR6525695.1 hypothetical protein [Chryseobacterium rhizosphaerae]